VPERQHHAIAGPDRPDLVADRLDDTGALVTEEHGPCLGTRRAVDEIGVADACGLDADQDLVGARVVDVDVGDDEGVRGCVRQHRGGGRHRLVSVRDGHRRPNRALHSGVDTSRPAEMHPTGVTASPANSYTCIFHPSNDELCRGALVRPTAP
jgi:hypothetical protein